MTASPHDPYHPPQAIVADIGEASGSPLKAVAIGLAVDFGGSFVLGLLLIVGYAFLRIGNDVDFVQRMSEFSEDPTVFAIGAVVGSFFSALGGYLCARIARRQEYRPVAIMTAISVALGAWLGSGQYALLESVALACVTALAIFVGARIGMAKNRRQVD